MNRAKQKGTAAETAVVRAATALGIPAHRAALSGADDGGDVQLWHGVVVVEVKAGDQTKNPTWRRIRDWHDEAVAEARNAASPRNPHPLPLLVTKRHGSGDAADWHAWLTAAEMGYAVGCFGLPEHYPATLVAVRYGDLLAAWAPVLKTPNTTEETK